MCSELLNQVELRTQINEFEMFIGVYNDDIGFRIIKRTLNNVLKNRVKKIMYK